MVLRRQDQRAHGGAPAGRPSEVAERPRGQRRALLLVVGAPRVVDGVVVEGRRGHGAEVGHLDLDGQLVDVTDDPRDVAHAVVPAMRLAMAADDVVEGGIGATAPADRRPPRRAQLDLVRHTVTLRRGTLRRPPAVRWRGGGLVDEPRWWFRGRKWCHLVSDESLEELHAFAARVGIPRRGFQGDHYDVPEEHRPAMVAAGAREVESRELVRRLRAAGLRLSAGPAPRPRASDARRCPRSARHRGGSPSRSRGHQALGRAGVVVDDEPLDQFDAERLGDVAGLEPPIAVVGVRAARPAAPMPRRGRRRGRSRRPSRPAARRRRARRRRRSVPSTTTTVRPRRSASRTSTTISCCSGRCIARRITASAAVAVSTGRDRRAAAGGLHRTWT